MSGQGNERGKEPRLSVLHSRQEALGAEFVEMDGWRMPAEFAGAVAEHKAVRESVGVFDLSHWGKLVISGDDPAHVLNRCLTNDVHHLTSPGKTQYTLACDDNGGVITDGMLYRFDRTSFMMFLSGAGWLDFAKRLDAAVGDEMNIGVIHDSHGVMSLQGPEAEVTLRRLGLVAPEEYMFFEISQAEWGNSFICRSDFAGVPGFDIIATNPVIEAMWDELLDAGVTPCGMRARDMLRLEAGNALHGTDFGEDVTAVEARLAWAIGWNKPEFWGKGALEAQRATGTRRRIFGLTATPPATLETGAAIYDGEQQVAKVTSACHSPTLAKPIALALFEPVYEAGTELAAGTATGRVPVMVVKPPFGTAS